MRSALAVRFASPLGDPLARALCGVPDGSGSIAEGASTARALTRSAILNFKLATSCHVSANSAGPDRFDEATARGGSVRRFCIAEVLPPLLWWVVGDLPVRVDRRREQQEQQEEKVRQAWQQARSVYGAEFDELFKNNDEDDALDEDAWHDQDAAELQRREEEAAAARWSELGRLGFAFTRSVIQQPDPFSKLSRYETTIARRLAHTRRELATLQAARERPE